LAGTAGRPALASAAQADRSSSALNQELAPSGPRGIKSISAAPVVWGPCRCQREGGCLMSHVQKRADRRYRARWLDPDGRERSRRFTRRAKAERHLTAVEVAKFSLSGEYIGDANLVTVGESGPPTGRDGSPPADQGNARRFPDQQARRHQDRLPAVRPLSLTWHSAASGGASAVHLRSGRPRSAPSVQLRHAA
jgi:hypothetical protein